LSRTDATVVPGESHDDIIYPDAIPFLVVHLACFAAIWTGITLQAVVICVVLYWVRMIGVTGGYHRYFAHRTYKTNRFGQFVIAVLAQSSAQQGAVWWAAVHRAHHRYSDTELDPHSPVQSGFWFSHVGWIFSEHKRRPSYDTVSDLTRYPELMWLDRHQYVVPFVLGFLVWLFAGWSGLVVGFLWSTVLCWHGTFTINSLAHVYGDKRYLTGDDSRNNWWLAVLTCGEGWHNNHHAYQSSTRQGFRWYQWDLTYYVLKVASWMGLVWDLRAPPAEVIANEQRLGRAVVEKVARQIADTFPAERMAAQLKEAWEHHPTWPEIQQRLAAARAQAAARLATVQLPELPTADEIRRRAAEMFRVPEVSLDEVAERARELLIHAVSVRLLGDIEPLPA
jgi:stearoyl-CoA desaturase (Delta-9 desaturase)